MPPVAWMPEAADELEHAWQWYAAQNPVAAERFADEVVRALEVIGEAPGRWVVASHDTRRFPLQRFPFKVVYRWNPGEDVVTIVAIAHTKRRDGYWRDR